MIYLNHIYQIIIFDHVLKVMTLYISYTFSISDITKKLESAQPIRVEYKFSENIPAGIYGYVLVLANNLVGINSDGQKQFNLI